MYILHRGQRLTSQRLKTPILGVVRMSLAQGEAHEKDRLRNSDPHGKSQHESGAKLDSGKLRIGLVLSAFSRALKGVAKVGTFGAKKYTDDGWLSVPDGESRYWDAFWRHLIADGHESEDPEIGVCHLYPALWNLLAVMELRERRLENKAATIKKAHEIAREVVERVSQEIRGNSTYRAGMYGPPVLIKGPELLDEEIELKAENLDEDFNVENWDLQDLKPGGSI